MVHKEKRDDWVVSERLKKEIDDGRDLTFSPNINRNYYIQSEPI